MISRKILYLNFFPALHHSKWLSLAVLTWLLFQQCYAADKALELSTTARAIEISAQAYAGSSVNVASGTRQTLFTDGISQYTGFYNGDGALVLGKRKLGEDTWLLQKTAYKGRVEDAHNTVSVVVDGDGYLHVAWDHHNNALNYAVSKTPGSLNLGAKQAMLGDAEDDVTYPQFFRLNNGDLLFLYRDGRSGNARLIMNYFNTRTKKWQRRSDNLISGENQRSAYWDMSVDVNAVLHLAWVWRESPDVASNHDIAYAQSKDFGLSWQTISGKNYSLPITQDSAEVIKHIPQNSNLMNPPVVAADRWSRPFIANYWSPSEDRPPQYHVLYHDKNKWHIIAGPMSKQHFQLKGWGTKRPAISRAALLVESNWSEAWLHLVYRDDSEDGGIIAASLRNLESPQWQYQKLVQQNMGAWEPSIDPMQWQRMNQAHMLVQNVEQIDGDDNSGGKAESSALSLLVWSPGWEKMQQGHDSRKHAVADRSSTKIRKRPFVRKTIINEALAVNRWHWAHIPEGWHYHPQGWAVCPLYIGALDMATVSGRKAFSKPILKRAQENHYAPRDNNHYDADDYCVSQAYLRIYQQTQNKEVLQPTQEIFNKILAAPSPHPLDWGYAYSRNRWSWSDSLFMGPMSWLLLWQQTGDQRYLDFMNREWWATTERLYKSDVGLYLRDESYFDLREQNGRTVHWARGTAWSFAGLVQIIEHFPKEHKDYARYTRQYHDMARAFLQAQQADGLWRPGLLDPAARDIRETSGSAFISFALASGIRQGLIDKQEYLPAVKKTWLALLASIDNQGKLRDVQPVGVAPHDFDSENAEPFAGGAFLLLAKELLLLEQAGIL